MSLFSWMGNSVLFHARAERNYLKRGLKMSARLTKDLKGSFSRGSR